MVNIQELRKRGYEEESIKLMIREELYEILNNDCPDFDEDPQGWLDAN